MTGDDERDQDIRDEIEFHLLEEQEELEALGTPAEAARRSALRDFGSRALVGENVRDVWVARWARELRQDMRFGVASFLFGVTAHDPVTLGLAGGVLLVTSLLAGYLPARRATAIDPLVALRAE